MTLPLLAALLLGGALGGAPRSEPADTVRERRAYVGMWTLHLRDVEEGLENNRVIGVAWDGWYGATFVNSLGKRAFSGGIQRTFATATSGPFSFGLGYRLGLVTGYDRRFIALADKTPVLPVLQPLVKLDAWRAGLEIAYYGVVFTGAVNVRL
jgi:hypothetical protein